MAPDAVVYHLQLLGRFHRQPGHVLNPLADRAYHLVLRVFQPGRLADAIVGELELARLIVLHRRPAEPGPGVMLDALDLPVRHYVVVDDDVRAQVRFLELERPDA